MVNSPSPLKKSFQYQRIREKGQRVIVCSWLGLAYLSLEDGTSLVGMTVSKKIGNAVLRNRLKRWVREYLKTNRTTRSWPKVAVNIFFRPIPGNFYKKIDYVTFSKALSKGFSMVERKTQGSSSSTRCSV